MTNEEKLDCELNDLVWRAAIDTLAAQTESDTDLRHFAAATIRASRGGNEMDDKDKLETLDVHAELARIREQHKHDAMEFVRKFVVDLCDHPMYLRSNSKKARQFDILFGAACDLACSQEGGEIEPWETFSTKLASADPTFPVWDDDGTPEQFRKQIISAFEFVVRQPGFSFVGLARAIQDAKHREELRAVRRRLGLNQRGKRSAASPSSAEDELKRLLR